MRKRGWLWLVLILTAVLQTAGCRATEGGEPGQHSQFDYVFVRSSLRMGAYTGMTAGGFTIDESWKENDGLVNTVSAGCPSHAPGKPLDRDNIRPGIWNIFPTVEGDHMWPQGGLLHRHDIRPFYRDLLDLINGLDR
jgi:triacylglycerol lipase